LNPDLKIESINALTRLVLFPQFVDFKKEFENILTFLLSEQNIRDSTLLSLEWTSEKDSSSVSQYLVSKLPSYYDSNDKEVNEIYSYFGKNCPTLHSDLISNLFSSLEIISKEKNVEKIEILLNSLQEMSNSKIEKENTPKFVHILVSSVQEFISSDILIQDSLMKKFTDITINLHKNLSTTDQQSVVDDLIDLKNFNVQLDSKSKFQFIPMLECIIIASHPSIKIQNVNNLLENLFEFAIKSESSFISEFSCHTIASIINKSSEDSMIQGICEKITTTIHDKQEMKEKKKSIQLFSWILKGVVMSGKTKYGDSLSKTALKLLLNKEISIDIAQAFDIALNEHVHLNKSTHAKIQVLYKQRFFSMNLFALLTSLKEEKENEFSLLLAVANMIKQVPHTVLLNDIDKIFPIVIQALSSSDDNLIMAGVKTILFLIEQSKQKVADNLNTIVSHLLKSALNMKSMV
jgi:hypothetical protein